ncbi:MAG TPA: hypothetical protein VFL93_04080 [Longimicrobiaceae bacterium]|jgi:hypothetical protein|nr:hypothetical protein [Longimicrobiaceae bacterium]
MTAPFPDPSHDPADDRLGPAVSPRATPAQNDPLGALSDPLAPFQPRSEAVNPAPAEPQPAAAPAAEEDLPWLTFDEPAEPAPLAEPQPEEDLAWEVWDESLAAAAEPPAMEVPEATADEPPLPEISPMGPLDEVAAAPFGEPEPAAIPIGSADVSAPAQQERSPFEALAERLEEIARALREQGPAALSRSTDPLQAVLTGYALGYAQGSRGEPGGGQG